MSFFKKLQTKLTDQSCLIEGLQTLKYNPVYTGSKQSVRGHGSEKLHADIVLRQEDTKERGDIGFDKLADGSFGLVLDTFVVKTDTKKFLSNVSDAYNKAQIKKLMAQFPGYEIVQSTTANGETTIRYEQVYA